MSYRSFMIAVADSSFARSIFLRNGRKPGLVRRYVAGDQLSDALEAASDLSADGTMAALDYLGENLTLESEIGEAVNHYKELIKAVSTFYPTAHVSIKLSALGMLVSEDLLRENVTNILEFSRERGGMFIRIDMEGSDYTDITLELVREMHPQFPFIGTVIQSYLRRSDKDIEDLNEAKIPVRLVKGAYAESPAVAFSLKQDVDRQFRKQMYALLEDGVEPAIATHDAQIIGDARIFIRRNSIKPDHYTFEMLMGVRRDLQARLRSEGHPVRVYIPYGPRWYPYFTRRLAEHPANLGFFVRNLAKG